MYKISKKGVEMFRRLILVCLVFIIVGLPSGFLYGEEGRTVWTEAEIEYFQRKVYEGDKRFYTEKDLYPPYILPGEASIEEIFRYLRLLRNEIFARHGYKFKSEDLRVFFGMMEWYKPDTNDINELRKRLNITEMTNVGVINAEEQVYMVGGKKAKEEPVKAKGYVKKILLRGTFKLVVEEGESPGPKEFRMEMWEGDPEYPSGFAVSRDGKIAYLLDTFNNRLQIFSLETGGLIKSVRVMTFKLATPEEIEEAKKILHKNFIHHPNTVS